MVTVIHKINFKEQENMEAVVGLLSAVLVAVITQIALCIRERITHKEQRADTKEDKQDAIIEKIGEIKTDVESLSSRVDMNEARSARSRILRFEDNILMDGKSTKSNWDSILEDIDAYESYCKEHPNFRNGIAVHAIAHLKKTYDACLENNNFLS